MNIRYAVSVGHSPEYYRSPEAILSRIERIPFSGCWIWMGSVKKDGYGSVYDGRAVRPAHRHSWEIFNGPVTSSALFVCHRCDVPSCVNPDHLFLGTSNDNVQDAKRKGRLQKVFIPPLACGNGHSLDGQNLRLNADGKLWRCRACTAQRMRNHRQRQREQLQCL